MIDYCVSQVFTNGILYRHRFTSYHNIIIFSYPLVLTVEFVMTEYNVSESDGTIEIVLEANGTSQFEYSVTLVTGDISTGENIPLFTCIIRSYYNVFKHTCVAHNIL